MVAENADFLTLAPYAPRFPFETWILPKQHESAFENSSSHMFENLAKAVKTLLTKADRVLDNPPYNLVVHTSPVQDPNNDHYHWHIEFMPKLTKTAGFEWGTGFYINPTPPEEAAKFLREASVEEAVPADRGLEIGRLKQKWHSASRAFLIEAALSLGSIQEFRVPCHLDGFQFALGGFLGIVFEFRQFGHVAMQLGKAHSQRIGLRMLFGKQDSDVVRVVPGELVRHASLHQLRIRLRSLVSCQLVARPMTEPGTSTGPLVFLGHVIPVPGRNLDYDLAGLSNDSLATETGV